MSIPYHGLMPTPLPGSRAEPELPGRAGDARRAQILAAAAELFARSGFHGTSIDELGAAVGTSGPAVYRYFPGKEAILTTLLVDISQSLLAGARSRVAGATAWDAVAALVDAQIDFALDNPTLITLHNRDLGALAPAEERRVRRLQRAYVQIWVNAIESLGGGFDAAAALAATHAVLGLINSTPHSVRLERAAMSELLHRMARAAIVGATGTAPAGRSRTPRSVRA